VVFQSLEAATNRLETKPEVESLRSVRFSFS
jgi:hypothetical protein